MISGIPRTQFVDIRDVPKLFPQFIATPKCHNHLRKTTCEAKIETTHIKPLREHHKQQLCPGWWFLASQGLNLLTWEKCHRSSPSSSPYPSVTPFWSIQLAKQRLTQLISSHYDIIRSSRFVFANDFWHPKDPICWHKRCAKLFPQFIATPKCHPILMKTSCEAEIETAHIKPLLTAPEDSSFVLADDCWHPKDPICWHKRCAKVLPPVHCHTQVSPAFDEDNLRSRDWDNSHEATMTAP